MENFGSNSGYIDDLYAQYLNDPASVSPAWREFFGDYSSLGVSASSSEGLSVEKPASGSPLSGGPGSANSAQSSSAQTKPAQPNRAPAADSSSSGTAGAGGTTDAGPPAESVAGKEEPPTREVDLIRGASARIVENMETSLGVPTATTVRSISVKLLEENRRLINQHQEKAAASKVSFTHLVAYAVVRALRSHPAMAVGYEEIDGKPHRVTRHAINLGIAIDVAKPNGDRMLFVPNIKDSTSLTFSQFLSGFNDLVFRSRKSQIKLDDFEDTAVSITNPGMLGTELSVPRLMAGQGAIVGIGSIGFPPHCAGMKPETISRLGLSKVMTLTSTYDHRVIQGAESGAFLATVERCLLGEDNFYGEIFHDLAVIHEPMNWASNQVVTQQSEEEGRATGLSEAAIKQARVLQMIHAYRVRGHLLATLDPLGSSPESHAELELYHYGLSIWDLDQKFLCAGVGGRGDVATLRQILDALRSTYCEYAGFEYMHLLDSERRQWLQTKLESPIDRFSIEEKLHILSKLNGAEAFEKFLGSSYLGQKRFSLEGCESLIPVLDELLARAAEQKVEDVVIGMAHRGRLNVLVNVVGKSMTQVFKEFEDFAPQTTHGSGDVKYHLGSVGTYESPNGPSVQVTLASNPSHLESVDPVVEGMSRAMQDLRGDERGARVVPLLIHGDAAFAGQGVVFETLQMSQLPGYQTGGTIHVIVNNQIGFTTNPNEARSSRYASDLAKSIGAPVFHVNADHPQTAVQATRLAFEYRQEFGADIVIDLVGYRRWGHNEGDEPALTQPLMYAKIRKQRSVRKLSMERLIVRGEVDISTGESLLEDFQQRLEAAYSDVKSHDPEQEAPEPQPCLEHREGVVRPHVETKIDPHQVDEILEGLLTIPDGFTPHPKLERLFSQRRKTFEEDRINWGLGEALAFGSLVRDGKQIRLSGEDSGRGTFNQRHAVIWDVQTGEKHVPLQHLAPDQGRFEVYDSHLSEFAVLGFDYGYSVVAPDALVCWEAQFGDFVNGAQVIIDQYISSAEEKWGQKSSLVLLLPHGYEGQGPEHSSARLERFLQLCSEGNIQVAYPTTPAQYFHLLRRQVIRQEFKPLIVMTPKSLLRLPAAASRRTDFTQGTFEELLLDSSEPSVESVERIILCSGKVYYDLVAARDAGEIGSVAILRVEQFYPFPAEEIAAEFQRYSLATEIAWVQEEPRNMGGWDFVDERLAEILSPGQQLFYVGRPWSASPATGSHRRHVAEQKAIVDRALTEELTEVRRQTH